MSIRKPLGSQPAPGHEFATLGGGCFWCLEAVFEEVEGVVDVESGYSGGAVGKPTYRQVCEGDTGHAEVVRIEFDPARISYREILEVFFAIHDPTTLNRQGNDVGTQYRSVIFFHTPEQQRNLTRRTVPFGFVQRLVIAAVDADRAQQRMPAVRSQAVPRQPRFRGFALVDQPLPARKGPGRSTQVHLLGQMPAQARHLLARRCGPDRSVRTVGRLVAEQRVGQGRVGVYLCWPGACPPKRKPSEARAKEGASAKEGG